MQVFGLSSGSETQEELDVFTASFQPSYPILKDAVSTYNQYRQGGGTSPYPLDYVIDQAGRVAYFNTEYNPEAMISLIDQLLLNPAPVGDTPDAPTITLEARPNPFNPRTVLTFSLPAESPVTVDIHDTRGRLVRRLMEGQRLEAGPHRVSWDGRDGSGVLQGAGLYLARVRDRHGSAITKLTLVK